MRIGQLRERLLIQSVTEAPDPTGEPIKTWANLDEVWGRAQYLTGRELEAAQKINAEITVQFTVRFRSDLTPKMRIFWNLKNWNILAVMPSEERTNVKLMASEVE